MDMKLNLNKKKSRKGIACRIISIVSSQMGHYKSISAMAKDIDLLTKNAKVYNEPGSQVYKVISVFIHVRFVVLPTNQGSPILVYFPCLG